MSDDDEAAFWLTFEKRQLARRDAMLAAMTPEQRAVAWRRIRARQANTATAMEHAEGVPGDDIKWEGRL